MARFDPYTLQLQVTRLFEQGQSFFAVTKVQDWLRDHNQDPIAYNILFHQKPAPVGAAQAIAIEIELQRKDGQPVDAWLQQEVNRQS
ncbi:MAG: hypothetical protein KME15_14175 [Drouetiella hepatica Uher 2000/2452]|jgi:hypothetical protein|uniref:Uncharacterized protein n=1 Tax=Drouetiella hepatica Uher 2000/2452 TaxID=904376 RepID=A0A951QBM4_9CYAN|nr:hypothetical protein [Drouetiella hepatica Uher 2000/2452]